MHRAQGALEYLIIISAVLAVSAIVVMTVSGVFSGSAPTASVSMCKQAAVDCKASRMLSPSDPCLGCVSACKDSATGDEIFFGATECCQKAMVDSVYIGSTGCADTPPVCGNSVVEATEECEIGQTCPNGGPCQSDCTCPLVCSTTFCHESATCCEPYYQNPEPPVCCGDNEIYPDYMTRCCHLDSGFPFCADPLTPCPDR